MEDSVNGIKLTWFDKLVRRSLDQKIKEHKHLRYCRSHNINNIKLEGRYPFIPIIGCTEFFASLFSIFNLVSHVYSYQCILNQQTKQSFLLNKYNQIAILVWISSTLFHINDITLTRYMDYFSAFLGILLTFYITIKETLFLYKCNAPQYLFITLVGIYVSHLYYMVFKNFDYAYNERICVIFIIGIYFMWGLIIYKLWPMLCAKYLFVYALLVLFSLWIEYIDFPPILYLIDSHALYHLCTAIATPLYYCHFNHLTIQ
ncbi:Protein PER1 like protein [Astathelohania contejeani]|uniref:Post-GPI attachment to proteins factor 3 n=1 Tax=Astathelohania contejeani TaxID=164912 RepID=A0ABQ7I0H3_9MICR|nr:Protein PER1 like protein [Thelohania contejeani]